MKCPNCGMWNRDSLPRCFKCGTPLDGAHRTQLPWEEEMQSIQKGREYTRIGEDGRAVTEKDDREVLAEEMAQLQKRWEHGQEEQNRLRTASAALNIHPSTRNIERVSSRSHPEYRNPYIYSNVEVEGEVRPNARRVDPPAQDLFEDGPVNDKRRQRPEKLKPLKNYRVTRRFISARVLRTAALIMIAAALLLAAYRYLYLPFMEDSKKESITETAIITPSILEDDPAHTIRIPGEEGASIYIKELRRSYTVTGGYATIEIADYVWYENNESVTEEEVTATITPYLKTNAGEQVAMGVLTFPVTIPVSPLTLVSPDTGYAEVSTPLYNIQFRVDKNSTVTINGENYSDLVNTQNGLISYNATVQPIGNNYYEIRTRCQNYRENSVTVTIYRAVQEIPLDLSTTLGNRAIEETMTITATTLPGATVTVETPHEDLDLSRLNSTGEFSFKARFETIGTNTITIVATYPGKEPSIVNYDVYYLPPAAVYTRQAWPLNTAWHYSDLLSNISARIAKSQIYVCEGTIVSILSNSPQLAIMEIGDKTSSRQVLLENQTTDTWAVGESYRVFADVYGLYNGMPRFVGRYTYPPR